jgi:hypothetical protein
MGLLIALVAAGCVTPPPAGVRQPSVVQVLPADARALRYGPTAAAVLDNPEMQPKIRALFGSDWAPAAQGGGRLQYGAAAYFPANSPMRMVRIDSQDYIAITGCAPAACAAHRGLLLIREDGTELWSRLDEGGFSRYYGHGPALVTTSVSPVFIDSAWRALETVGRTALGPRDVENDG